MHDKILYYYLNVCGVLWWWCFVVGYNIYGDYIENGSENFRFIKSKKRSSMIRVHDHIGTGGRV